MLNVRYFDGRTLFGKTNGVQQTSRFIETGRLAVGYHIKFNKGDFFLLQQFATVKLPSSMRSLPTEGLKLMGGFIWDSAFENVYLLAHVQSLLLRLTQPSHIYQARAEGALSCSCPSSCMVNNLPRTTSPISNASIYQTSDGSPRIALEKLLVVFTTIFSSKWCLLVNAPLRPWPEANC